MNQNAMRSGRLGRPREFNIEEALDAALVVFSERGYQAASISELAEAMGLTAGSIYKAFGDKRGVFLAAFDRYWSVRHAMILARIAPLQTGREKLFALLQHYGESAHGEIGRRGCMVVGGANDLALLDAEAAARVATAFDANRQRIEDQIVRGQTDGSIRPDLDADVTASALLCLTMGMRVVGKTGRTEAEMLAVAEAGMRLLD
ncbi:TetR/AcrR family transcriptional regulator [Allorhizobium taibaishanense]|uniref:AcrR family transcriptional regulator n=1 Tax=Allorhizobium taibaishanense TaxID=887144 RepID=A0A1Q9A3M5_9HYPH|nr:TetR/AcrR family transcriptional regulator [Allorhizobium taibaishanense]MBB4006079.1 AcrR family transcriptional regulator [Allorhizobium taibaishanense]OLP49088.1 TetR family transcriptional regulator [Allorhizobium taibaishanense]